MSLDGTELVRYVHTVRRMYLQALSELSWDEVIKDRQASFSSLRDIFVHALGVEDRIINYVIPGKFPGYEKWDMLIDLQKFSNIAVIREYVDEVEKKVAAYLMNMTTLELDRTVPVPRRTSPTYLIRVEDNLAYIALENIYHMGEMEAIFYQMGKQPPFLDWSSFKKNAHKNLHADEKS